MGNKFERLKEQKESEEEEKARRSLLRRLYDEEVIETLEELQEAIGEKTPYSRVNRASSEDGINWSAGSGDTKHGGIEIPTKVTVTLVEKSRSNPNRHFDVSRSGSVSLPSEDFFYQVGTPTESTKGTSEEELAEAVEKVMSHKFGIRILHSKFMRPTAPR